MKNYFSPRLSYLTFIFFFFSFLAGTSVSLKAAGHFESNNTVLETENTKLNSYVKKDLKPFFSDFLNKKITKKDRNKTESDPKKLSKIALITGLSALGVMLLGTLGLPGGFLLAVLAAIVAIVFGGLALSRIKKTDNPEDFKKARRNALIGIWAGIFTIVVPIAVTVGIILLFW